MSGSTVALIGALFYDHPQLMPILDEHLEDNEGEILAYLVLSDVIRWMAENYHPARSDCVRIIEWLEKAYTRGDEDVRNLIGCSVEMIPDPDHPGYELRDLLGPQLRATDPWSNRP
jgi:hypothetical protein